MQKIIRNSSFGVQIKNIKLQLIALQPQVSSSYIPNYEFKIEDLIQKGLI